LTAALAKKSRCWIYETPRIRRKAALILPKKSLNDLKRILRAPRVFLLCVSEGFLAGSALRGITATYFVRYAQLEIRTNITPRGMRCNRGLIVIVKNLNAKLSTKPENMKKQTMRYSKRKAKAKNNTIATNPFGAVHLKITRFNCPSDATVTHQTVVSLHHLIIFLRILLRTPIVLLMLTRFFESPPNALP